MSYKMGSVSSFWCHVRAYKFMLAYIYHAIFRVGGGVGDYLKYSLVAAKILLLSWENVWKDLKKQLILKMYITMKNQFILHDKNIVRFTSNQPPIPCLKPHKTWRLPTNHRLLLHVALVFSTFAWLWMFLTEFARICRNIFRYCGARGKFLTLKNVVTVLLSCFTHK